MRDYNKEAEAVCKMLGANRWSVCRAYDPLEGWNLVTIVTDSQSHTYNLDSPVWWDLVKQATEKEQEKMTNDELDDLLEELYSSEEFLVEMEHRLEELRGSQERTIEVIEEVERRIKVIRDKLRGA